MKKEQSQKGQQKRRRNLSEFEGNDIRHENIVYVKSKRKSTLRKKPLQNLKKEIKKGYFYICAVYNKTLCKRTVKIFEENKNKVKNRSVFDYKVCSSDEKQHVCLACHKELLKGTIPVLVVCNNLQVF